MAEPAESPDGGLTRLRLDLAYEGTQFQGWAKQPGIRTVQGELEAALATVFNRYPPAPVLTAAGRTDAGVHATGQVAHLDLTPAQLEHLTEPHGRGASRMEPGAALAKRLNGIAGLRSDIHVSRAAIAAPGFDARFSPVFRRYEYRIADAAADRNPLLRHHTVWYPARLDLDAMNTTAQELLGLHDWAAYCRPRPGATTIRQLQEFTWQRDVTGVLVARLKADAFCHSMVRALVGAAVSVGEGKLAGGRPVDIRDEAQRTSEFKVMPPHGLTLVEVGYPDDSGLAARAEETRARRDATAHLTE
ncbi:tRNA pseudouridine(38-40) synthase TruA [soil metagenome]